MIRIALLLALVSILSCKPAKEAATVASTISTSSTALSASTPALASLPQYAVVESLLAKMTLEEKVGQMNMYSSFIDVTGPRPAAGENEKYENLQKGLVGSVLNVHGVADVRKWQRIAVEETRLGIPLLFGYDIIHGYKVLSPIPLAEAASWDLGAIQAAARVAAAEAASAGLNWTFAPMMDISRDARWGRVMEGGGEDPYLSSKVSVARVRGFQGSDLSDPTTIAACAKHFAGYGFAEAGRDYNTVDVSGHTLHNVILPPFRAVVEAGVATVMSAFNDLNGEPAVSHEYLQRSLLKGDWGFEGVIVSDWGSIMETTVHGATVDLRDGARQSAIAGCDIDMESSGFIRYLADLVRSGTVEESVVDDAARRILNLKYELGLFDDPYLYCDAARQEATVYAAESKAVVRDIAKRSIVLLKHNKDLLPLRSGQKVAVIGPLVEDTNSPLGSWRIASDDSTAVSLRAGLEVYGEIDWSWHQGVRLLDGGPVGFMKETAINITDTTGIAAAVRAAKAADVVVMALGEYGWQSGEGRSRLQIDLPGLQQELLEAVYAANPNVILLTMSGRPLALPWAADNVPAMLHTWHLGSESGNAIADVLMGAYNPSGKLPMTFPRAVGQAPIYYNYKSTGRPTYPGDDVVFWSHYIDGPNTPQFAFGHGLSYTTFDYTDYALATTDETIEVTVTVSNTGSVVGEEVVQVYIHDIAASVTRPEMELKAFDKVLLAPGESRRLSFSLDGSDLGFYDNDGIYHVEKGAFDIMVGGSSDRVMRKRITW